MLDTFKHIETLEESGLPKKQAEAQMKVLIDVTGAYMVTKEELKSHKEDFRIHKKNFEHHMEMIQKDFSTVHKEIRHQSKLLHSKIEKTEVGLKHSLTIRLGGLIAGLFTIGIGIIALLVS